MDSSNKPIVEQSARGLEVRSNVDLPIAGGLALPFTGGMSVAPLSSYNLPEFRRPATLGGTGKDPIFELNIKNLPAGFVSFPEFGLFESREYL